MTLSIDNLDPGYEKLAMVLGCTKLIVGPS